MELTIEQALQQGVTAHREGKVQEAEGLYRAILQSEPSHPDANHNLGLLAVAMNKADVALPLLKHWYHMGISSRSRRGRDSKKRFKGKYSACPGRWRTRTASFTNDAVIPGTRGGGVAAKSNALR